MVGGSGATEEAAQMTGTPPSTDIFTGDDGSPAYNQWKAKMKMMSLGQWVSQTDQQKANLIMARVGGSASSVLWNNVDDDATTTPYTSPATVYAQLETTYGVTLGDKTRVLADLRRISQGSKRAAEYLLAFQKKAAEASLTAEELKSNFLAGLAPRIQPYMVGQTFASFGDMTRRALEIDTVVDRPSQNPAQGTGGAQRGRGGFRGRGRGRGRGGYGWGRGAQEHAEAGRASSSNDYSWVTKDHTCFSCNGKGHIAAQCGQNESKTGVQGNRHGKAREVSAPEDGQEAPPMYDRNAMAKRARVVTPSISEASDFAMHFD